MRKHSEISSKYREFYDEIQNLSPSGLAFLRRKYIKEMRYLYNHNEKLKNVFCISNKGKQKMVLRTEWPKFLELRNKYKLVDEIYKEKNRDRKASPSFARTVVDTKVEIPETGEIVDTVSATYNPSYTRISVNKKEDFEDAGEGY